MGEKLKYMVSRSVKLKWYIRKLFIIWSYLFDFIRYWQFNLLVVLAKSLLIKKSNSKDLIVDTYFGRVLLRKNTMDFKMANPTYERHIIKLFKKELQNSDLVIDIGANCGLYSIISGQKAVKTIAFEPINDNFETLKQNISLNNLKEVVKIKNFALGNTEEKVKFNYNEYNTGTASRYRLRSKTIEKAVEIKIFDNLQLNELKNSKNTLIKLDVEGMEVSVIEGMQQFISSTTKICFFIETKHTGIKRIQNALSQIAHFEFIQIDSFNMLAKKTN